MNKPLPLNEAVFYSEDRINASKVSQENFITIDNILQNKSGISISQNRPKGTLIAFAEGDILIGNIRPYLKKIWFSDRKGGASPDVLVFKSKEGYNPKYIYYTLFRDDFFLHMMKGSKGTKMPRGDKSQILSFLIPEYNSDDQQKISSVLSSFDSKIELNNRINIELETMAKTVYDYWFLQFDFPNTQGKPYKTSGGKMVWNKELKREIPAGWKTKKMSEWIKADKSGDWGSEIPHGNYTQKVTCIRGADINGLNGLEECTPPIRYILEKNKHKILNSHDVIIEISGGSPTQSTGRLAYITDSTLKRFETPLICSNFCKAISIKNKKLLYNFVYYWNSLYDNGAFFGYEGKTSGIKNLLFDTFVDSYWTVVPEDSIVEKFYEIMENIQNKKQIVLKENHELANLRDWLLPLLMNGQVKVK
jgi:restriction endonuclease S subunit